MDGYRTAMYFIVLPAVFGPVFAILFVVAVYLCRRRHHDGTRSPSTVKGAPTARVPASSARLPPTIATDYWKRSATSRIQGGVEAGIDEETQMMLPRAAASGRLLINQLPSHMPGIYNFNTFAMRHVYTALHYVLTTGLAAAYNNNNNL